MSPRLSIALLWCSTPFAMADGLDFYRDIYPGLKANCISCHNKTTTKGGLNMESPEAMLKGGDGGPGLIPGQGENSLVVLASRHLDDLEMPPANNKSGAVNLSEEEIVAFSKWIDEGAKSSKMAQKVVQWQKLSNVVQPIYAVVISPDGRYAACGRGNRIYLYDLATQTLVTELKDPNLDAGVAHRAVIQSLSFSPDGQWLASGSYREAKLWKVNSSQEISWAEAPALPQAKLLEIEAKAKAKVIAAAISPAGDAVAFASSDGSVRVWNLTSQTQRINTRIRYASQQSQLQMERGLARLALDLSYHQGTITKITAQNKALDELLKKAKEAVVAMTKVLPDKEKLLAPAQQGVVSAKAVVEAAATAIGDGMDAAKIKAHKDAQDKLITAQNVEKSALAGIHATKSNIADAQSDQTRISQDLVVNEGLISKAKEQVATLQKQQSEENAKLAALKKELNTQVASQLRWSKDGKYIAATYPDGSTQAYSAMNGQALVDAKMPNWSLVKELGQHKDGNLFADRVNAVCFSPDGKKLATGGGDLSRSGDIHWFEVASGKLLQTWTDCHDDSIFSLAISPDGKTLVAGSADKIAKGFDTGTGKATHVFAGHTNYVNSVAYRADGRVIATAGADGIVMTWDAASGERIRKIQGWVKEITSVNFIDQSSQLLTASGENMVRVVSETGGQVRAITNLPDFMQSAVANPGGKLFVGGGEDSVLRVWEASTGKELANFGPEKTP